MKITFDSSLDHISKYWLRRFKAIKKNSLSSKRFQIDLAKFLFYAMSKNYDSIYKDFPIEKVKDSFKNIKFFTSCLNFYFSPPLEIYLHECDNRVLVPLALHEIGHSFQYKENRIFMPNEEGTGPHVIWQELDAWNFAWQWLKEQGVLDEEFKKIIFLSILSYLINFLYLTKYDNLDILRDIKKWKFTLDNTYQPKEFDKDFIDFIKPFSKEISTETDICDYPSFIKLIKENNEAISIFRFN